MDNREEVLNLLTDDGTREVLIHASRNPMTARELSNVCDVHHSTIYRRIDRLQAHDLLEELGRVDPDGHHSTAYKTKLREVTVKLTEGGYDVRLRMEETPSERMAQMWREIREDRS